MVLNAPYARNSLLAVNYVPEDARERDRLKITSIPRPFSLRCASIIHTLLTNQQQKSQQQQKLDIDTDTRTALTPQSGARADPVARVVRGGEARDRVAAVHHEPGDARPAAPLGGQVRRQPTSPPTFPAVSFTSTKRWHYDSCFECI